MEHTQLLLPRETIGLIQQYTPETFLIVDKRFYADCKKVQWQFALIDKRDFVYYGHLNRFRSPTSLPPPSDTIRHTFYLQMQVDSGQLFCLPLTYRKDDLLRPRILLPPTSRSFPLKGQPFVIGGDSCNYYIFRYDTKNAVNIPRAGPHRHMDDRNVSHRWYQLDDPYLITVPNDDDPVCFYNDEIGHRQLAYYIQHPERSSYQRLISEDRLDYCHQLPLRLETMCTYEHVQLSGPQNECNQLSWDEVNRVFDNKLVRKEKPVRGADIGGQFIFIFAEVTNVSTGETAHVYVIN